MRVPLPAPCGPSTLMRVATLPLRRRLAIVPIMTRTIRTITVTTRKRDLDPARGWLVYAS